MSNEFRKQMMEKAQITPCREFAYTIKTCHMIKIINKAEKDINKAITKHLEALIDFWKNDKTVPKHLEKYRSQYVNAYKCVLHNHQKRDVFNIKKWLGEKK